MSTVIVIPARYASTRFPGKPLAEIAGCSMIKRVYDISSSIAHVDKVVVATDDERIFDHVENFGGEAVMTPETCRNGTERCWAAADAMDEPFDTIINMQGDAVLTPPWILQAMVDEMRNDPDVPIATPAVKLSVDQLAALEALKAEGEVGGTTVTFDMHGDAMYFSKRIIPLLRKPSSNPPVYRHIGIYAYRRDALEAYLALPPGMFEQAEEIEAIRALEHGMKIRVVLVDYKGRTHWSVDDPADVARAEAIIDAEGELCD